jgi:hypothetical protein
VERDKLLVYRIVGAALGLVVFLNLFFLVCAAMGPTIPTGADAAIINTGEAIVARLESASG